MVVFIQRYNRDTTSCNEQLIKEIVVKDTTAGWQELILNLKPEFENEICNNVTVAQIESIISDIKEDRAPGGDGVPANMLKLSSLHLWIQNLTDRTS